MKCSGPFRQALTMVLQIDDFQNCRRLVDTLWRDSNSASPGGIGIAVRLLLRAPPPSFLLIC